MSNMGYCRFRNTLGDFEECIEHIDELISHGEDDDPEFKAMRRLVKLARQVADEYFEDVVDGR